MIDQNCDLYNRTFCKVLKLLWFTSFDCRCSVDDKLSRGKERNNAVCVTHKTSFWTKSHFKNIVWLPAFKSIGHWPEFFKTLITLRLYWTSRQLPSKIFFDSCFSSPCWQSMTVVEPSIFFKSPGSARITKPFCSTFPQNMTWSSCVALSIFHKIFVHRHVASLGCWVVGGIVSHCRYLWHFWLLPPWDHQLMNSNLVLLGVLLEQLRQGWFYFSKLSRHSHWVKDCLSA